MDAALKKTKLDWNPTKIEEIAQHCNDRKLAAKAVSGICKPIFFVKSQCPISIIRHLTIFFFLSAFQISLPEMFLALFVKQSGPILVEAHCSSSDGPFYGLCSVQYGHY